MGHRGIFQVDVDRGNTKNRSIMASRWPPRYNT